MGCEEWAPQTNHGHSWQISQHPTHLQCELPARRAAVKVFMSLEIFTDIAGLPPIARPQQSLPTFCKGPLLDAQLPSSHLYFLGLCSWDPSYGQAKFLDQVLQEGGCGLHSWGSKSMLKKFSCSFSEPIIHQHHVTHFILVTVANCHWHWAHQHSLVQQQFHCHSVARVALNKHEMVL